MHKSTFVHKWFLSTKEFLVHKVVFVHKKFFVHKLVWSTRAILCTRLFVHKVELCRSVSSSLRARGPPSSRCHLLDTPACRIVPQVASAPPLP